MRRYYGGISSPVASLALLLICSFHCAAAAAAAAAPLQAHRGNGVKVVSDEPVLQKGGTASGDELAEVLGAEEPAAECEEGDGGCLQRRLLRDAHLDYIYTQHKGKP